MTCEFLKDVRVLDLSQFLPGPFATQMLADMGADVVKVEPPKGDPMRTLDPVTNSRGESPYYALVNAGKTVTSLDLKAANDKSRFERLVAGADVLMESYRPGVMARLGFGSDRLREINPGLVHCALSGYGQNGPLRLAAGHDINYVAAVGQLDLTGTGEAPHMAYPMVADYAGAIQAVTAILGALVGRGRTGQGAYLDVAMADAVLAWQSQALTALARGDELVREGSLLTGGAAFYAVYETSDHRFVSLGAIEAAFWENFCNAIARPDLIERQSDPLPQTALINEVAAVFRTSTRDEWDALLSDVDCCYHPVLAIDEVANAPQARERALIVPQQGLEQEGGTSVLLPFWIDGKAPNPRLPVTFESADDVLVRWKSSSVDKKIPI